MWTLSAFGEIALPADRAWRRARIAPVGQQIWGFQSSHRNVTEQFGNTGSLRPLGQNYSRQVTWRSLLLETKDQDRPDLEGFMRASGSSENDIAATAKYQVQREELGFQVGWAYGLMRSWMVGFELPVTFRRTRVATQVTAPAALRGFQRRAVNQTVKEIAERELVNSGYDYIPDQSSEWMWGDVTLLSQVSIIANYRWQWSLQQIVRLPTARNPDLDEYIQTADDSGQVDLGLTSLVDYRLRRGLLLGVRGGFIVQLPDSMKARVPTKEERRSVDPKVSRDLGDWSWATVAAEYRISGRTSLEMEHSYLYKFKDKYQGHSADGFDYATLSAGTEQDLQQTQVSMNYDFVSGDQRAGIRNKWVASLGFSYPWTGHNVSRAERTNLDITTYF